MTFWLYLGQFFQKFFRNKSSNKRWRASGTFGQRHLTDAWIQRTKQSRKEYRDCNDDELHVLGMLYEPTPKEILMQKYDGDISKLNMILTLLEIKVI